MVYTCELSLTGSFVLGLAFVISIDYNCTQKGIQKCLIFQIFCHQRCGKNSFASIFLKPIEDITSESLRGYWMNL